MNNRKRMPKTERNQNGRSNVRVLHFPASVPTPAPHAGSYGWRCGGAGGFHPQSVDTKVLGFKADFWSQSWLAASGRRKNLVSSGLLAAHACGLFGQQVHLAAFGIDHPHLLPVISELFGAFQTNKISSGNGRDT